MCLSGLGLLGFLGYKDLVDLGRGLGQVDCCLDSHRKRKKTNRFWNQKIKINKKLIGLKRKFHKLKLNENGLET